MRVFSTVFTIPFLLLDVSAAPRTRTSTLTIIPLPTSTVNITHTGYYPTGYPTGTGTGSLGYTNYTLHKTLHYPTTTITRQSFSTVHLPSNATAILNGSIPHTLAARAWPPYLPFSFTPVAPKSTSNATSTGTGLPASSSNATILPPLPCILNDLYCNSPTSFSLCAPAPGGATTYVFMGPVAEGTVCKNGSIGSVGEGDCTPVGALSCADDGGMFFLCGEGGLVNMGSVALGTMCVDGHIVAVD